MELPIAPQSYLPTAEALVRAVQRARAILARTAAEETALDGATAFTNPDRPGVRSLNFAADLQAPGGTDGQRVVTEVLNHFEPRGSPCHFLESAEAAWPAPLEQAAHQHGFQASLKHVLLLSQYKAPARQNQGLQTVPARAAYRELPGFYRSMARHEFRADDRLAGDFAATMIDWLDEPRLELFLARLDNQPVGVAGVLTLGQIGVVSPAYTDPAARGQGVAATLMAHTLNHCARAQMEQIVLQRSDGCYSIRFYESLGFSRVASYTRLSRSVS